MNAISPFRFCAEDLPNLDRKTREGLQPLIDRLNVFVQEVSAFALSVPTPVPASGSFITDATGNASVLVRPQLPTAAAGVGLDKLTTQDGTAITSPYAMSWAPSGSGVLVQFSGLEVSAKYQFTLSMK